MARVERDITLRAPLADVYAYVLDPANLPEFWPGVLEVTNIKRLPNGGYSGDFVYQMAGMRFTGHGEDKEIVPNQWMVTETSGGIRSRITWTFRARGNRTRVTLTVEYIIPIPLLGRLAEAIVVKMNEQEADKMMNNLRAIFEPGA